MDETVEAKIYKFWQDSNLFTAQPNSGKSQFGLLMPPPNLTGELHLGHAMQHSILDAIARFKRMQGFDVLLLPGVDHAGIQFEGSLNKRLEKEDMSKHTLGREEWLKRAQAFKEEVYSSFHETWTVMGISADWSKEVFTLDPKIQTAVFNEFKTFWEQDLLYKGAYIVQWCPKCGTAIEDIEMEYQEKLEKLYFIRYKIEDSNNDYITVATARPETIFSDTGIAVYPNHPKFAKFVGKKAINPLNNLQVPIFEDSRVDKEFGTGALKITPGHDLLDFQIGKEHDLAILHAIDKSGRMGELAGGLKGLKISQARELAAEELTKLEAIEKSRDYTHSVPVCERCKTTIEPLISEEWFVKMQPLAKKGLENISKIKFYPENYQQILSDWMEHIHDWSISRSLWWGIRIPVWYCQKCNSRHEVGKDKDMVVSQTQPDKSCQTCQEKHWVQDEAVLDTWFSSGIWPLATLGWPDENSEWQSMQKYYPWSFEISAPEIKYLWIARMIMLGVWFTDNLPFINMFFHGMLRDLKGQKFSKSLGNGINPNDLRKSWGTDALRMSLFSYSAPGRDSKTSRQIMDERCKNYRNFTTKLKNIYRFIYELRPESEGVARAGVSHRATAAQLLQARTSDGAGERQDPLRNFRAEHMHQEDLEIIQSLNATIDKVSQNLENFQLHLAVDELYDFIWHKLADSYIEWSKQRRQEAQPTLEYVFQVCLKLLHPFMPFITEQIWQDIVKQDSQSFKKSIMQETWPKIPS